MCKDIIQYIKSCERCQIGSTRFTKTAPEMHSISVPDRPWVQVRIDLCSLPKSKQGFIGICVAVDYFTKWVEAEPICDKSAVAVASFLYRMICRHGCFEIQINDQGREFF